MRRIFFAILCGFLILDIGSALAEEKMAPGQVAELSALDGLKLIQRNGGVAWVTVAYKGKFKEVALDVSKMEVPAEFTEYWSSMEVAGIEFAESDGRAVCVFVLISPDGRFMVRSEFLLEKPTKPRSDFKVGKAFKSTLLEKEEDKARPDAKPGDKCTIGKPCDSMKKGEPCPHHGKGQCEHMEQQEHQHDDPLGGGTSI